MDFQKICKTSLVSFHSLVVESPPVPSGESGLGPSREALSTQLDSFCAHLEYLRMHEFNYSVVQMAAQSAKKHSLDFVQPKATN